MNFIAWVYTVPMRLIPLLTAILALASSSLAAKIEGVYVGTLGKTSVVFKLEKPGGSDLSGVYFYRNYARDIQTCSNDSDGFTFDPKIVLYSKRILRITGPVYYDCGGAHPDGYSKNLTIDLQTGTILKLEDLYRFAAVPTGLNLQKQEPFELFSSYTQAQAVVLKKLILQESKTFTTEAYPDCNDLYETGDVFGFITWYLTPEGLIVQPSFPHVAAVCEKDFLLPYAKLKAYLAVNSPLK